MVMSARFLRLNRRASKSGLGTHLGTAPVIPFARQRGYPPVVAIAVVASAAVVDVGHAGWNCQRSAGISHASMPRGCMLMLTPCWPDRRRRGGGKSRSAFRCGRTVRRVGTLERSEGHGWAPSRGSAPSFGCFACTTGDKEMGWCGSTGRSRAANTGDCEERVHAHSVSRRRCQPSFAL